MKINEDLTKKSARLFLGMCPLILVSAIVWLAYRHERQKPLDRALITAIKENDTAKVLAVLDAGADANARDFPIDTRSFWQQQWEDMILRRKWSKVPAPAALLLVMGPCPRDVDRDPNRNVENQEKRLFLMTALLNKGADVNVRDEEDGLTPLHYAAELGFIKDMQLLLKYGAQIDQRDGAGQTPLFSAVRSHGAAVGLLLDRGANTSLRDRDGHTALHIAAMEDERSAELLLKRGADGHVKDNYGATPLKIAQIHHCLQAISLLEQWEARNPRHL